MVCHSRLLVQLSAVLLMAMPAGCSFVGQRVAEKTDPFLPTSTAERPVLLPPVARTAVMASSGQVQLASFDGSGASPLAGSREPDLATDQIALKHPLPVSQAIDSAEVQFSTASRTTPERSMREVVAGGVYPIDLANALGLGGADSLQIRQARTRLFQAQARHFKAKTLWLPSLRFGVGYNKHDGRLQETVGNVLDLNRNSFFYGGGLGLGNASLAGGSSGPARLMVNLSLADAWFEPLSACQEVAAFGAGERVAQNDVLADIAIAYHSLVEAYGRLANAQHAQQLSQTMVDQVANFEKNGFSSQTEVSRAKVDQARWQRAVADAERQTIVRSAELARLLRLPPQVQLVPAEEYVLPVDFIDPNMEVDFLVAQGLASRPEVAQYAALREAACFRVKEEQWRPWIPSVQVGASSGGFGGGPGTSFPSAAGRSDVDVLAVWEWQNLGLGNVALQRQRRGELHMRLLELEALRDRIATEVVAAAADVSSYRQQMEIARDAIEAAGKSYQLNEQRIRASEGLPIELLQSIAALADAQNAYTDAVANYNRSQYHLMRAIGNPAGIPAQ